VPFDQVRTEHVRPAVKLLVAQAQNRIEAIATEEQPRTFRNTLGALDQASEKLDYASSVIQHLENVVTSPELRAAWNEVQPLVSEFYSRIPLHAGLWSALKEYASTAEAAALTGVHARFLKKTIDSFRRHGAELDAAGKTRLAEIDVELSVICTKFGQNVLDATAQFEYVIDNEQGLAGLPAAATAAARQSAEARDVEGWRFTLQQPSYLAILTYLDDSAVREHFYRAYNRRAAEENTGLLTKILELRREKARLLGFKDFADFALAERMAKSGGKALGFLRDLEAQTVDAFRRENAELEAFRAQRTGQPRRLDPWEVGYWAEKQRAAEFDFHEENLRPYFPLNSVLNGLFELVQRLYGIEIVETPGQPVWHEEVKYYEVRDTGGAVLGGFYADWFPRDTKRGGAWMGSFLTGHAIDGVWRPHVGVMCGNVTPPLKDRPALLSHREVETVFHEFGHLMHHCLSRVEVRSLAGTSVAWDFVELPSQIMENWCWERASLDLFARHWKTGECLPDELFEKVRSARTFRAASSQMRQLGFSTVDLSLHMLYDPARDGSPVEYANRILQEFSTAPLPEGYAMIAAFTHLFADPVGYGAGYYSYKWAEVLDADAFTRFLSQGIFSRDVGRAFRREILEKGDSEDPAELFRRFMGRDPDPSALLRRLGLVA
ncbi:MAG: M3 family metallopeptidase, partial [Bryobacteraceae bacterium]